MAVSTESNRITDKILKVESHQATWRMKCRRNLQMYEWTRTMDLISQNDNVVAGYSQNNQGSTESDHIRVSENVIRSCIETLTSKIASQKVMPHFNLINGDFHDFRVRNAAQQFFDVYYQEMDVNKVITQAFQDSCVTDRGIIYINRDNYQIERIQPWQFFFDPREYAYGSLTQCAIKRTDYPTSLLDIKTDLDTVTMHEYWDVKDHKHITWLEEINKVITEKYEPDVLPFVILRWSNPMKSSSASCVVDLLFGIQREINYILAQIADASQSAFGNKYIVPSDSNVQIEQMNNRNGELIKYDPQLTQSGVVPIQVVATPFMDAQWFEALEKFKQDAYEMVGISQLSATSQKPRGLNSGVGLQTMEDIESDRFETQLNTVIRAYTDIAKVCMSIFNPEDTILPESRFRSNVKWADIVNARDNMSLQFSSIDSISKDPSTKQRIVSEWVAQGYISKARAGILLEVPDVENGYSLINNNINAVMTIIDDCILYDRYEIPDYVDNNILQEEIVNTLLSLRAANYDKNKADIAKLTKLFEMSESKNANSQTSAEYAASMMLQEEMANVMPQIQAQAQQLGQQQAQQILQAAMPTTTTATTPTPTEQQNTSDEECKEEPSDTLESVSNELLTIAKKYYYKNNNNNNKGDKQ